VVIFDAMNPCVGKISDSWLILVILIAMKQVERDERMLAQSLHSHVIDALLEGWSHTYAHTHTHTHAGVLPGVGARLDPRREVRCVRCRAPPAPWGGVAGKYRGLDVIRKEATPFYRTISGVRLYWVLEEPKGPKCWA
jgi:hypothetical protein